MFYINDKALSDFGIVLVADPKGWRGPPGNADSLQAIPGRMGQQRVSRESTTPTRRFTVQAILRAATQAAREPLWDAFTQWVTGEELEFRFDNPWPNRMGYGRYDGVDTQDIPGMYHADSFTMSFTMFNPLRYERSFDTYTIAKDAEVALLLGSAPSDMRIRIVSEGLATPEVLYKDAQGRIRSQLSLGFTGTTFPAAQWIDYNWDGLMLGRRYNVVPPGYGVFDLSEIIAPPAGVSLLGVADPADGDATQGPTLTAVNCHCTAEVRRAWL